MTDRKALILQAGPLAAGLLLILLVCPNAQAREPFFEDTFDKSLGEGWEWIREDPKGWRIRDGALEIRISPKGVKEPRNVLRRRLPTRGTGTTIVSAKIRPLKPLTEPGEQVGLRMMIGDRPAFMFVQRRVKDGTIYWPYTYEDASKIQPGEMAFAKHKVEDAAIPMRLILTKDEVFTQIGPDAKGGYRTLYFSAISEAKEPEWITFEVSGAPKDKEHWVRIDDFQIRL